MKLQYSPAYLPAGLPLSLAIVLFISYIVYTLWKAFGPGLGNVPGPRIARLTRLYLVNETRKGKGHTLYCELHAKYGPIVRIAPNKVTISDPVAIPLIYGVGRK